MSILDKLSSRVGDRTADSNRQVVIQCLADPDLLAEIAGGLTQKNAALVGDCAEVMTLVAEQKHPELVAPYANALSMLLNHKTTRVRWEAMHALALVAALTPATIASLLPKLVELIRTDSSVIVRDYATDAIANYAGTGKLAAQQVYPWLKEALTVWDGKHAKQALQGLANVATLEPALANELCVIAEEYSLAGRAVVRKAAKKLLKIASAGSE